MYFPSSRSRHVPRAACGVPSDESISSFFARMDVLMGKSCFNPRSLAFQAPGFSSLHGIKRTLQV